jgi:hypothetical protein
MNREVLLKVVLSTVVGTAVYSGLMWFFNDFDLNAAIIFFGLVLVINLFWHSRQARKAKKGAEE